ncbi:hypothetical protein ARMSODRAFT_730941 [Armillaria solidipes]|uniref:Uncharacterized protein n=1 Tax=Armillaria solidipes TaxID=1076256 RepID=A0A2H3AZQ6_9AGAR|nr:hypothetical protein ARMSODRAFT_730941 [Armillaria solidipes]
MQRRTCSSHSTMMGVCHPLRNNSAPTGEAGGRTLGMLDLIHATLSFMRRPQVPGLGQAMRRGQLRRAVERSLDLTRCIIVRRADNGTGSGSKCCADMYGEFSHTARSHSRLQNTLKEHIEPFQTQTQHCLGHFFTLMQYVSTWHAREWKFGTMQRRPTNARTTDSCLEGGISFSSPQFYNLD